MTSTFKEQALLPTSSKPRWQHPIPLWRRRYMVALFSLSASLLFADQNLLAPNLSVAGASFGYDSEQSAQYLGGYVSAVFFCVGAPAAVVLGALCDRMDRRNLLFWVVLAGEVPCICTYWVTSYWQFMLTRILTGISVGGCFPIIYSLISDLFPAGQRAGVACFIQIATGLGITAGQALSALVASYSDWRVPFVVIAIPTILVAALMRLTTLEPPRGGFDEVLQGRLAEGLVYSERLTWAKVKTLLQVPSNWFCITQGLFGSLPWGMYMTFLNDYLNTNRKLGLSLATTVVLLFGVGGGVGVIFGGIVGQRLYNRRKEWMVLFISISTGIAAIPGLYVVNVPSPPPNAVAPCIASMLAGFFGSVCVANLSAINMNVNVPEMRGAALALSSVANDIGKGASPFLVALFINALGQQGAFNIAVGGWVPCAVLIGCMLFCLRQDEEQMQAALAQSALAPAHEDGGNKRTFEMTTYTALPGSASAPEDEAPAAAAAAAAVASDEDDDLEDRPLLQSSVIAHKKHQGQQPLILDSVTRSSSALGSIVERTRSFFRRPGE